jgi:hypothetical protein
VGKEGPADTQEMPASRILVAAALLAGLAAPATASAAHREAPSHQTRAHKVASPATATSLVKSAATVARRYWGVVPCSGQITYGGGKALAPGVDPTTDAWATFDSSLGANNLAAPASSYQNCAISLARWRWPTAASMAEDWDMFCTTVVHETGHLLGRPHDLRHGSVMAPVFTDTSSVPSICRKTRPRAAR